MTPYQAARFCLWRGEAERLEQIAIEANDTLWPPITRNIAWHRDAFYIAGASTITAVVEAIFTKSPSYSSLALSSSITIYQGITLFKLAMLYADTVDNWTLKA